MQKCPHPLVSLRVPTSTKREPNPKQFICKKVSAGSRHTLYLMIDCSKNLEKEVIEKTEDDDDYDDEKPPKAKPKRQRKLLISGLNHVALCEEAGFDTPVEIPWDESFDRPADCFAGRGTSFVVTKRGHVYSWGFGRYGVLGHGDSLTLSMPRRITSLDRHVISKVSVGAFHAVALTDENKVFSWGRNNKGQLGICPPNSTSEESFPIQVTFPQNVAKAKFIDIACGFEHSIVLIKQHAKQDFTDETFVFGWGDYSKGQLGSGDAERHFQPQENRYVTKLQKKLGATIKRIVAGGFHNLALLEMSGQVIAWGGNEYGQCGFGNQFDATEPKLINNLEKVTDLSAGLRHSAAIVETKSIDVYTWGYNGFGELGLSDTEIRLQPTKISAIKNSRVLQISCGDRHMSLITSHRPLYAKELPALKPYFRILEEEGRHRLILRKLKVNLIKEGLEPNLIDDPNAPLPNQMGYATEEIKNEPYEKGLRYCLDTFQDKYDWRRKALEACFECFMPNKHLKKVCLSCARNCLSSFRLRPYIRNRNKGDTCDCRVHSGMCVSKWSVIRKAFDDIASVEDKCIGPNQIRGLLKGLRSPFPVESADIDDCLSILANGVGEVEETPRIKAVAFEKWYRKYYDEPEQVDVLPNIDAVPGLDDL
jgi:hypothetical protein